MNFKNLSWFNTGIKNLQIFGRIKRKVGCGVDPRHAFATLQLITYAHQHWYPRPLHGPCSSWRGTVWRMRNSSFSSHLHSYVAHFHLSVSKKWKMIAQAISFFLFKLRHLTYTESRVVGYAFNHLLLNVISWRLLDDNWNSMLWI